MKADDWIALFTLALVIIGVIQATIFISQRNVFKEQKDVFEEQAKQLKKTVDQMQVAEQRELRAYVFADEHPEIHKKEEFKVNPNGKWKIPLTIANYGKTPAYDVMMFADSLADSFDNPQKLDVLALVKGQVDDISLGILGPGGHASNLEVLFEGGKSFKDVRFNETDWFDNKVVPYVFGTIIYRDVFGKIWQSNFRYMNSRTTNLEMTSGLNICRAGNVEKECDSEILKLYNEAIKKNP